MKRKRKDRSSDSSSSEESREHTKKKRKKFLDNTKNPPLPRNPIVISVSSGEEEEEENIERQPSISNPRKNSNRDIITISDDEEEEEEEDIITTSSDLNISNKEEPPRFNLFSSPNQLNMKKNGKRRVFVSKRKKKRGRRKPRKLVIKKFEIKRPPKDYFETTWETLHGAINSIFQRTAFSKGYEPLYQDVQNLVLNKHSEKLYEKLKRTTLNYVETKLKPVLDNALPGLTNKHALTRFNQEWEKFTNQVKDIHQVFLRLDRSYIYKQQKDYRSIWHMCVTQFRDLILPARSEIRNKLIHSILHFIEQDRDGALSQSESQQIREKTKKTISIFYELDLSNMLESKLLEHSGRYFDSQSRKKYEELGFDVAKYLLHLEVDVLTREHRRMDSFGYRIHRKHTPRKLTRILLSCYFERFASRILEAGFPTFFCHIMEKDADTQFLEIADSTKSSSFIPNVIKGSKVDDLLRLFNFTSKLKFEDGIDQLRKKYEHHIMRLSDSLVEKYRFRHFGSKNATTPSTPMTPVTPTNEKMNSTFQQQNELMYVEELMILHLRLQWVERACFRGHTSFLHSIRKVFSRSLNKHQSLSNRISHLLSRQIHSVLCKVNENPASNRSNVGFHVDISKEMNDEDRLLLVLKLYQYLESKDFFEESYKVYLAKRLILGLSKSNEIEKFMIDQLKTECGTEFTNQLDGMFKDIDISKTLTREYKIKRKRFVKQVEDEKMSENNENLMVDEDTRVNDCPFKYSVTVIKTGHFPPLDTDKNTGKARVKTTQNTFKYIFPREIEYENMVFNEFYIDRHSGRKLQWLPLYSTCWIQANFIHGTRMLYCSAFQTAIILSLNSDAEEVKVLKYKEISDITGMETMTLRKNLVSLTMRKNRILRHQNIESNEMEDEESDKKKKKTSDFEKKQFFVNKDFRSNKKKIQMNSIQIRRIKVKDEVIEEKALITRECIVDAAAVRIMKVRKQLKHQELVNQVIKLVLKKFKPNAKFVKKRIESLIDREYIKRCDNNKSYEYIA